MVFRSFSKTEIETSPQIDATTANTKFTAAMASSTTKSHQPLHNFPLQDLKWSMNHTNNHRFRKLAIADSSHKSTSGSGGNPAKAGNSEASSDRRSEKSVKKWGLSDFAVDKSNQKSTIKIRIKTKNIRCGDSSADAGDQTSVVDDVEETLMKTWNLRPRRAVTKPKPPNGNGGATKTAGAVASETKAHEPSRLELTRSRNANNGKVGEKKEKENENEKEKEKEKEKKLKFSISLTKDEIEEDVLALTGSKPARRSKKRARNVQKQIDNLFPGLWLSSITPDSYKVSEPHLKVQYGYF